MARITLCLFCEQPSMNIKYDKKGRPYLACDRCGTKCFVRTGAEAIALYGLAVRIVQACPDFFEQSKKIRMEILRDEKPSSAFNSEPKAVPVEAEQQPVGQE